MRDRVREVMLMWNREGKVGCRGEGSRRFSMGVGLFWVFPVGNVSVLQSLHKLVTFSVA